MNFPEAIQLARPLKYGPLPPASKPDPSPAEARELIKKELKTCGHVWLTGEEAIAALDAGVDPPARQYRFHQRGAFLVQEDRRGDWNAFTSGVYKTSFGTEAQALEWLKELV